MNNNKSSSQLDEERYKTVQRYLLDEHVLVHVNPTLDGVVLPPHLMAQPTVTLKLSKLFRGGITVHRDKIVTDLLFGDDYFTCTVPLNCIWGVTTLKGESVAWPDAAPKEVVAQLQKAFEASGLSEEQPTEAAPVKAAGHLKRVK